MAADPAIADPLDRDGVQMVPPLATLSPHDEQARLTQQIEVLHHRGAAQPVKAGDEFSGGLWPAAGDPQRLRRSVERPCHRP